MLSRTAVAGFVVLVTAACRGGPAAPSGATTFSPALLQAGPHVLTLEAGSPVVTAPLAAFLCITFGSGAPTSAGVPVSLTVEGAGWRGSGDEGDLVLRLSRDGEVLSGTGRGRARTPGGVVVELGRGDADARLVGRIGSGGYAEGSVDGSLTFSVDGGSTSCSPSRFQLSPR